MRYAEHTCDSGKSLEMLMATEYSEIKFRSKETKARLARSVAETI